MKSLTIALKDTLIRFRDRNAILLMIAAPLLISFVMGAAFGGQNGDTSPISEIPLIIVNADQGDLAADFVEIVTGIEVEAAEGPHPLFRVTLLDDKTAAIERVERGEARGALYLPPDFSRALTAGQAQASTTIEVYTDPAASLSPAIIRGVVRRIASGFNSVVIANQVAVEQLTAALQNAGGPPPAGVLAKLDDLGDILAAENAAFAETAGQRERIAIRAELQGQAEDLNLLNYFVPSMAIFFLMFAVFDGTRSILEEERDGTLHRLMTTPTSRAAILLGKIGGAFLTGLLQFAVLVLASWVFFGVDWGKSPLGIALLALATVAAATSLGAFVASFARDVNQAGVLGTAITLVFAILGGNFIDYRALPAALAALSKLTVNRWALEGFVNLTLNHLALPDILPHAGVLFAMAAAFFALAVLLFNRRFVR